MPANTALRFLVAAREGEIDELEHLAQSTALVTLLARFIHALQRERGLVNLRLADGSGSFDAPWREQVQACLALEGQVRHCLQALDLNPGRVRNGVRLFSRIAQVMHAMDSLPALRARVSASTVSAEDATAALVRLVGGLLSVVFEAADAATDPAVSRALVALFNFMQGKEFAGQERALGARVFTAAHLEDAARARWQTLLDAQSGCLQVFQELGHPPLVRVWQQSAAAEQAAQVMDRLRAAAHQPGAPLLSTGALNLPWYEACTARIDAMKELEDHLCEHLRRLCSQRIEQAREELRDHRAILDALQRPAGATPGYGQPGYGPHVDRAVVDLLAAQARRLQSLGDELDAARAALRERKLIERAKGLLMSSSGLDEDSAYQRLRRQAMDSGQSLHEVARQLVDAHARGEATQR